MLREYAGVPSLLYDATSSPSSPGARILLKREDLNHTGAHKIRNVLGQALLTKRMGKTRVIAETGAGQHGVATATAAAYLGLDCVVYMGEVDTQRQALNVARMQLLGAEVVAVTSGSRTLKDAINEAIRDWVASVDHTAYLFGTAAGPHPFPSMVRDFCRGIGDEARAQCLELTGALPDAAVACVGGGSNAIGLFTAFLDDADVRLVGFEAGRRRRRHRCGTRRRSTPASSACCTAPAPSCSRTRTARPSSRTRSRPGLDYPGVGPEHAYLAETRPRDVPPGHRRRGDGRVRAALAAPRASSRRSSPRTRSPARWSWPRSSPDANPGEPVRPRRQGHGHRRSSGSGSATPDDERARGRAGRGPGTIARAE